MSQSKTLFKALEWKKTHADQCKGITDIADLIALYNQETAKSSKNIDLTNLESFTDDQKKELFAELKSCAAKVEQANAKEKTEQKPLVKSDLSKKADAIVAKVNAEQRAARDVPNLTRTDLIAGEWGKADSIYINGNEVWVFSSKKDSAVIEQSCIPFVDLKTRGTDFFHTKPAFQHWSPILIQSLKRLERTLNGI